MAASCSLDHDGRERQLSRYAGLAPSVVDVARDARRLRVEFASGYDRPLLDELVAVERECCPFLGIDVDERSLSISVASDEHAPMLDVFAEALSGATATPRAL
jgi:hypothetical protein